MNIFITGESGTIPRKIAEQAKKDGHFIMNDFVEKSLKKHQSFKIRNKEIDFCDRKLLYSLDNIFNNTDVIIHSGAYVGTDFCAANPEETILTNVQGTKNIVDICNDFDIKLVYYSTTAIYDPKHYSRDKLITEQTQKNPQTLYGITKYAGEMIVDKECKMDKMILRPVFGFGDFPHDLHSALTKLIYHYYNGGKLNILLNKNIEKTYTRVENIAKMTLNAITLDKWNDDFNIGDHWQNSHNWFDYMSIIEKSFNDIGKIVSQNVDWQEEKDYLHWHQIETTKIVRNNIYNCDYKLEDGIKSTINSVIESNECPYWI